MRGTTIQEVRRDRISWVRLYMEPVQEVPASGRAWPGGLSRQIHAGVVMDTHDFSFDPSETSRRYPSISLTSLAEVVRRDYVD